MQAMMWALAAALGAYGASLLGARLVFRRILFPVAARRSRPASCVPDDARVLRLEARDGAVVHALDVAPAGALRGTLVYFHGNGETAADVVPLARMLADDGLRVVVLEYRGYGCSQRAGAPDEAGLYADAAALLEHLSVEGRAGPGGLALWGTSLGSGVAVEMAQRFRVGVRALVLVCPFTSIRDVCRRHAPVLPSHFVVRDVFDSAAKAREISAPTLIVHGEKDRLVPAAMGRALAAAIPGARYVGLAGAGHDIFATHGDDVVREALAHVLPRA